MPRTRGFTLLELLISGVLLAMLMLAVMAVLSQAQRDMQVQTAQTEVTEKTRKTMEAVTVELRESSIHHVVAGWRGTVNGNPGTSNVMNFPAEPDLGQCPDQFCPWFYSAGQPLAQREREPHAYLMRQVQMDSGAAANFAPLSAQTWLYATGTTTAGRIWSNNTAGTQCPAGHTITALTTQAVQMGAIMFASPRNREGRFVSREGANRATDWQALVFLVPYSRGAGIVELRRYVVYIDDLLHDEGLTAWTDASGQGVVAPKPGEQLTTLAGAGATNGAFATNTPVGKPTLLDLLDYDGDGATADGVFDITDPTSASGPDATTELFQITGGGATILYQKTGTNLNFSITIDRETGDVVWDINHTYSGGAPAPAFVKRIEIKERRPTVVASSLRDIEFATIRNCAHDGDFVAPFGPNPTGLVAPQDTNVIRVTAFFDKVLGGRNLNGQDASGNRIVRAATSQEVVVTRVQPRN